jgi:hypothetical protein
LEAIREEVAINNPAGCSEEIETLELFLNRGDPRGEDNS